MVCLPTSSVVQGRLLMVCVECLCRLFGTKCDKCGLSFSRNDFVMRAKTKIYHIECFRCSACERQLIPGDEFALREDGLFCKEDHEVLEKATNSENNNNTTNVNNNNSSHNNNNNNNEGSNSELQKEQGDCEVMTNEFRMSRRVKALPRNKLLTVQKRIKIAMDYLVYKEEGHRLDYLRHLGHNSTL
ncbi:hypothetical protein ANN_09785 [Periplaneta americana]|uniref:LIM zinc-binding domain-containing protein n=1 Tax=Periplaneta americana TaxID=6978 RepID=A0ABQ8TML7_PERAM|nr:hypothetical protein ANN_09785 [Periplaneta americana]